MEVIFIFMCTLVSANGQSPRAYLRQAIEQQLQLRGMGSTSPFLRQAISQHLQLPGQGEFSHDDVIKWEHFPRYWPFVRGIHWSPVNSPGSQRPVARSFDVFFDLRLNKRMSKQPRRRWIETPSKHSLWRHCNVYKDAVHVRFSCNMSPPPPPNPPPPPPPTPPPPTPPTPPTPFPLLRWCPPRYTDNDTYARILK